MNSHSLHAYFKELIQLDSDRGEFEWGPWHEREGVFWISPNRLLEVFKKIWMEPQSDPHTAPILLTHVGNDERELGNGFVIYILLNFKDDFTLTLGVRGIKESFPSLTTICPALNWAEREVQDMFGLKAIDHPDPRPLVLHPGWSKDFYPLRKSSEKLNEVLKPFFEPEPLYFPSAQGEGTFEIPVGPIHAGIIEPGHFRFHTIGETILNLDCQLFYTHKGVEKLLEGKSIEEGLRIVERVCGVCTVSHSLAYCEAVEKLAGIKLTKETLLWRTILAELERLYNHVGDIGNICAGVGFALGNVNGLQNKEQLQRFNKEVFGHRFLRGTIIPGGIRIVPSKDRVTLMKQKLKEIERDFETWIPLILEHDGFRNRAVTTGVLKNQSAKDLCVTGPAARASGVSTDWRERHAHLMYPDLRVKPQVETSGDVWARLMVRVREVQQSYKLLGKLLQDLNYIPNSNRNSNEVNVTNTLEINKLPPYQFAWGCTESPRGTDVIWLMTDLEGRIYRCRIRSASYANWPAVPLAVLGNIIPDFPLINKSFELCYSCCDR